MYQIIWNFQNGPNFEARRIIYLQVVKEVEYNIELANSISQSLGLWPKP